MDLKEVIYITEERLTELKALFIGIVALVGFFVSSSSFFESYFGHWVTGAIDLVLLISWAIFWFYNRFSLPRNKKDKVGIVIAIFSENEKERKQLKADFISKLKADFREEGILDFAEIIFLKNHFARQIKESSIPTAEIEKINKKIKAHFYVWGDIKTRTSGDEGEKYFLYFHGYVVHKPISQNLSLEISKDFSKVLPQEVNFLEKRGFEGFEASARLVHLAAKYIIGVAAFVSQNPQLALRLHSGLMEQFNLFKPLPPHLQDIRNRIPILVSEELLWIAKWHFENERYDDAKSFLDKSLSENNNNYGAFLLKAVIDFLIDNSIEAAFKSLSRAEKYAKNTFEWRYSKAFLYFWSEDYDKALTQCQKIKNQSYASEFFTLENVRKFNLDLISKTNFKPQLYFWMGYLSYFKEKNMANALDDFENFERLVGINAPSLRQKSSAYLKEIKKVMSIDM